MAGTHLKGPLYVNGNEVPTSSVDSSGTTILTDWSGNYLPGSLAFNQLPNATLSDTVTTQQQLAVATIPGGLFKANSVLEVEMLGVSVGAGSRTIGFKAGAASGTLATATAFGGTGGVASHGSVGVRALLWGNGVLGAQRATPNGPIDWAAAHAATLITLGIDTELDWNIYVYVTFAASGAGDTFQLRPFWATWRC